MYEIYENVMAMYEKFYLFNIKMFLRQKRAHSMQNSLFYMVN